MFLRILFVSLAIVVASLLAVGNHHIRSIFRSSKVASGTLSFSPNKLSSIDSGFLILLIFSKYAAKLFGQARPLLPSTNGDDFALPALTLEAPLLVDSFDVEQFKLAVNSKNAEGHSPLLLSAVTTPMMLILLSNFAWPVLPFGAVNTKNRFEFLDPIHCRRANLLKDASVRALVGGDRLKGRRVKRGMEFDVVIEVQTKVNDSSEIKLIFRQIIGILVFLPKSTKPQWTGEIDVSSQLVPDFSTLVQQIDLTSSSPKLWASVCKDINPIHVSSLAAKIFGFPGKIAHGNHAVAILAEKLRNIKPGLSISQLIWESSKPCFVEVAFKRPMVLPISLEVKFQQGVDARRLKVARNDKVHIEGSWGMISTV
jgi:acyl dehydratase